MIGNRSYAFLTGLFVLTLTGAVLLFAWWMSGGQTQRVAYTVVTDSEVTGLSDASPVFYRGVRAGRVLGIRFNPDDMREILIDIEADASLPITQGTWASLRPQGLTGLSQLVLHDEGTDPEPLTTTAGDPAQIPMRPGMLESLLESGETVLANVERVSEGLGMLVSEENLLLIGAILANVEAATAGLGDLDEKFAPFLAGLPELSDEALRLLRELRALADGLQALPPELIALIEDVRELSAEGQDLGGELRGEVTPALRSTLEELAATAAEMRRLARHLQQEPQSILHGPARPAPGPGERGHQEEAP